MLQLSRDLIIALTSSRGTKYGLNKHEDVDQHSPHIMPSEFLPYVTLIMQVLLTTNPVMILKCISSINYVVTEHEYAYQNSPCVIPSATHVILQLSRNLCRSSSTHHIDKHAWHRWCPYRAHTFRPIRPYQIPYKNIWRWIFVQVLWFNTQFLSSPSHVMWSG